MLTKRTLLALSIAAATFGLSRPAQADTYNWNGGAGDWDTTTANWTGSGTTWPTTGTDNDAVFGGTAGVVTLTTPITANDLTFNTTGYTVAGTAVNTLTLNGTTPTITTDPGVTATINAPLTGNSGLVKSGPGTLTLSSANTYTGTTNISGGILSLNIANAISSSSPITLGNATLQLNQFSQALGALTVDSGITTATITMPQNSASVSHTIAGATLSSPLTLFQSNAANPRWSQITWTSKITGTGGGSGNDTLIFENTSSMQNYYTTSAGVTHDFTGNIRVKSGVLAVQSGNNGGNLVVPDASMVIIDGGATWRWNGGAAFVETIDGLAGGGAMTTNVTTATVTINASNPDNDGNRIFSGAIGTGITLVKNGTGTQTLSGANTYTGATTINDGMLRIGNGGGTGSLAGGSAITVNANGTLQFFRNSLSVGITNSISGAGPISFLGTGTSQQSDYIPTGIGAGYTGTITVDKARLQAAGAVSFGNAESINVLGGGQLAIGFVTPAAISRPISIAGTGWLESNGPYGAIRMENGSSLSGPLSLTANATIVSGVNTATANTISGTIDNGGFTLTLDTRASQLNLANAISGLGGLTKIGASTLTLASNDNNYGGTTRVNVGTLAVTGSIIGNGPESVFVAAPDSIKDASDPAIVRRVGLGASYTLGSSTGLGSTAVGTDPVTASSLNTTAAILAGIASADSDVSMQWRTRTTSEADASNTNAVLSDVVNLTGVAPVDGFTDVFLLEMSYNDAALAALGLNEASIAASGELRLGWLNGSTWTTAVDGNSGASVSTFVGIVSATDFLSGMTGTLADNLGSYGVDLANNKVWAVLDHNSEFAVIPEPSTLVAGGLAMLGFAGLRLRRKRT